ncbi:hypothetical protein CGI18_15750 [Vibrio parahaemolyticus]|nr:hypothetical protein [Vibrio parahaemolyticus]TOK45631.1 hypothetical protein CGI18_15750 [Vibrio parahaemolyticus]
MEEVILNAYSNIGDKQIKRGSLDKKHLNYSVVNLYINAVSEHCSPYYKYYIGRKMTTYKFEGNDEDHNLSLQIATKP